MWFDNGWVEAHMEKFVITRCCVVVLVGFCAKREISRITHVEENNHIRKLRIDVKLLLKS